MSMSVRLAVVACVASLVLGSAVSAADWPQFRGPNRDGACQETGLLKEWPKDGPKLLWEISGLGVGYSTVSIANGKLYIRDQDTLFCYDVKAK